MTATTWVYPGSNLSLAGQEREDGFLLEIPGLMVQLLNPLRTSFRQNPDPSQVIPIRANVTMMCGCPISNVSGSPWPEGDFDVVATIVSKGAVEQFRLSYDDKAADNIPSQFYWNKWVPGTQAVYEITVHAYQKSTGNTAWISLL